MAVKSYDIDIKKLVYYLIDGLRRDDFTVSWCYSLLAFVKQRYNQFKVFSAEQDELLKYAPGHTIQLERLLNDKFGSEDIFITNNKAGVPPYYAYTRGDSRNQFAFDRHEPYKNSYAYTRESFDLGFANFTVSVPVALAYDQTLMEAYIKLYKPAGLTFEIVTY